MDCAAGTDAIKVVPKGCKPVSKDRCASGFMAPAGNVTFPKNPLETCCKCKEGETCPYCLGAVCTPAEKKKYVTDKDCYAEPQEPVIIAPSPIIQEQEETFSIWNEKVIWVFGILIVSFIAMFFVKIKKYHNI